MEYQNGEKENKRSMKEHRLQQLEYCEMMGFLYPIKNSSLSNEQIELIKKYTLVADYKIGGKRYYKS